MDAPTRTDTARHAATAVAPPPSPLGAPVVGHRAARSFPWAGTAAAATAVAGGLHFAAAATHTDSGDLVLGFFGLTGFVQLATAAAVVVLVMGARGGADGRRPVTALLLFGSVVTAALLCLYVVVHGTDLLAGLLQRSADSAPGHTGHGGGAVLGTSGAGVARAQTTPSPEPVEALGTATVAVEVLALTGFIALLPERLRRRVTDLLLLAGLAGWALWLTGALD